MPRTVTVTFQDGSQHVYQGVPDNASPDQVTARAQADFGQSVTHLDGGNSGESSSPPPPASMSPRWDVMGDIGRAASDSGSAFVQDVKAAFPGPKAAENGPVGTLKRMGSAAKVPLDALGVIASPITGLVHSTLGSGLSYLLPTINTQDPQQVSRAQAIGFEADPKKAADAIVDKGLMALGPRGMGNPEGLAATAENAAIANQVRKAVLTKNKAIDIVNRRAVEDSLTPEQLMQAQSAANTGGDQVTLMDLGDKNVRGLAGSVYRAPGPAGKQLGDFLDARDAAAGPAITKDIQGNVAKGSTYNAVQDLLNNRSAAARPAYQAAEDIGPIHSDRLQQFLDTPEVKAGLARGLKLERLNAISENRPFNPSDYAITSYQDGKWDMPIFADVPTMKSMIVANEGLGAQIADMINPVTGRPTKDGLALKKFRDAFQGELDSLSGGKYAAARDVWSGPAQSMEAVADGKQHFTRPESNEQLKAEFDALSPGDKDFYRLGAAEAKIDQLERAPDASDKSKRVINSERDRKRFSMLFDSPQQAQQFIDAVARKRQAFETNNAITGNSQTAARMAEDVNPGATALLHGAHGALQVGHGNILGAANSFLRAKRDLGLMNNPALNSEIAKILMDPNLAAVTGQPGRLIAPLPVPKKQGSVASAALIDALLNAPRSSGSPYNNR